MRERSYLGLGRNGFHRVAYTDWGEPGLPALVCVHGLTRNGRDFDWLAAALADRYHVACPDIVGRGNSDWLDDKSDYGYPQYLADMAALLARLDCEAVDWVGTSMGGLIGMFLAALDESPIRRLVINDVGPFIPAAALARIAAYVGQDPRFPDLESHAEFVRQIYAPFGPLSDEQWRALIEHSLRIDSGGIGLAYDPGIAVPFQSMSEGDVDLWHVFECIDCDILLLRGEQSDVLTRETAEQMVERARGDCRLIEYPGIGHAPTLMSEQQIGDVREWLLD